MSTLIIFEGADNSGKTTAAKAVAETLGYEYRHGGTAVRHSASVFAETLGLLGEPIVLDRCRLISHPVYEHALNGLDMNVLADSVDLTSNLLEQGLIILVMARPPIANVLDMSTHIVKPHDTAAHIAAVEQNKEVIAGLYETIHDTFSLTCARELPTYLVYDYTTQDTAHLAAALKVLIEVNEEADLYD